jgi:hypothetical protein
MELRINFSSGVPIYVQLMEQIKHAVETGAVRAGEQLPAIRKVAEDLAMNPNTVVTRVPRAGARRDPRAAARVRRLCFGHPHHGRQNGGAGTGGRHSGRGAGRGGRAGPDRSRDAPRIRKRVRARARAGKRQRQGGELERHGDSKRAGCARAMTARPRCGALTWRCRADPSAASWAATEPARPPPSSCCSICCGRTRATSFSLATRSIPKPRPWRRAAASASSAKKSNCTPT